MIVSLFLGFHSCIRGKKKKFHNEYVIVCARVFQGTACVSVQQSIYHEKELSQIGHGLHKHDVVRITAVRDYNLGANSTCIHFKEIQLHKNNM